MGHVQGRAVVTCSGEIDLSTVPAIREAMEDAERPSQRIIIDLSALTFLDSTGVGVLLSAVRSTRDLKRPDGALCMVGATGLVLRVLTITGFTRLVPVCASVEEATAQPA